MDSFNTFSKRLCDQDVKKETFYSYNKYFIGSSKLPAPDR